MTADDVPGDESPDQRDRRRWVEILQELRVAQTGVQVLTGFLLTLPFSSRFSELGATDRRAYLVTVSASVLAAGLLVAPVSFHRVLVGRREKDWLVDAANHAARWGLGFLALTMSGVMFLVFGLLVSRTASWVAGSVTMLVLALLWVAVPLLGAEHEDSLRDARTHRPRAG